MRRVAAAPRDPALRCGGCTARRTRRGRRSDGVEAKVSAPVVRTSYFGVRRRLSTSMRTTRRDDVKQLSQQLVPALLKSACLCCSGYTQQTYLVRLLENDKCELRAAVLRLVVSTRHQSNLGSDGFLAFPTPRPRTISYGQKPLPYNTSTRNLLASGERSSQTIFSPQ